MVGDAGSDAQFLGLVAHAAAHEDLRGTARLFGAAVCVGAHICVTGGYLAMEGRYAAFRWSDVAADEVVERLVDSAGGGRLLVRAHISSASPEKSELTKNAQMLNAK